MSRFATMHLQWLRFDLIVFLSLWGLLVNPVSAETKQFDSSQSPTDSLLRGFATSNSRRLQQDTIPAEVFIQFDDFANEIGWSIWNRLTLDVIVDYPAGTYTAGESEHREIVNLEPNTRYIFGIRDTRRNGMLDPTPGFFYLKQDETRLVEGDGNFGTSRLVPFETLDVVESTPSPSSSTDMPSSSPTTMVPTFSNSTFSPSPSSTLPENITQAPSNSITTPPQPDFDDVGMVAVTLEIEFDSNPEEISWFLIEEATDTQIAAAAYTGTDGPIVSEDFDLVSNNTYVFVIEDSGGDGFCCPGGSFRWIQNGTELVSGGGNFGSELVVLLTTLESDYVGDLGSLDDDVLGSNVTETKQANITVLILLDEFPEETGWAILDNHTGAEIIGVPSGSYDANDEVVAQTVALEIGRDYDFIIMDSFGDGLTGRGIGIVGSYLILQDEGDDSTTTLVSGQPDFEFSSISTFTVLDI